MFIIAPASCNQKQPTNGYLLLIALYLIWPQNFILMQIALRSHEKWWRGINVYDLTQSRNGPDPWRWKGIVLSHLRKVWQNSCCLSLVTISSVNIFNGKDRTGLDWGLSPYSRALPLMTKTPISQKDEPSICLHYFHQHSSLHCLCGLLKPIDLMLTTINYHNVKNPFWTFYASSPGKGLY